ncbi:class II aldolase and adducin, partial [Helicosporidium sp. ATCC 50920]
MATVDEARSLICELCRNLYAQGQASGTGGGISIRVGDKIVMAPSGVQKERMQPEDMFVLDRAGNIVEEPIATGSKPPKLSECAPLFQLAYDLRGAGAVLHGHSHNAVLATMLNPSSSEFVIERIEMIKGIAGHGYFDPLVVPIVENTARECELTDRLRAAMEAYPLTQAVLVRNHGVYVWGRDWVHAKTQAECYEYLFDMAVRQRVLGLSPGGTSSKRKRTEADGAAVTGQANGTRASVPASRAIVLDIEGTVAPISFVHAELFPHARAGMRAHLDQNYACPEVRDALDALAAQSREDVAAAAAGRAVAGGAPAEVPFPSEAPREQVVPAAMNALLAAMEADRKLGPLKTLQGQVWKRGFRAGELRAQLFEDVEPCLREWASVPGLQTYIFSSGSREAQRLLFQHTAGGDLRPLLQGYFDTSAGAKHEAAAYRNIALSVGADEESDLLFLTDVLAEAQAARRAGWHAKLVLRPGNKPIDEEHDFEVIRSLRDVDVRGASLFMYLTYVERLQGRWRALGTDATVEFAWTSSDQRMRISTAGPRCIAVRPCDSSLEPSDGEEDSEEEGPLSYRSQTNFMRRFETLMQQQQWPGRDAFRRASP